MKIITFALILFSTTALADGPPPGFWGSSGLPNASGPLYLKWCTKAGWPCIKKQEKAWGQLCDARLAQMNADEELDAYRNSTISWAHGEVTPPFTEYAGWHCDGMADGLPLWGPYSLHHAQQYPSSVCFVGRVDSPTCTDIFTSGGPGSCCHIQPH